jgi:hypothetical protein
MEIAPSESVAGLGGRVGKIGRKSGGSLYWVDCGQENTVSGWNGRAGGEWSEDNLGKASSATGRLLRSAEFPGVLVLSTGLGALGGRERRGRRQKSLLQSISTDRDQTGIILSARVGQREGPVRLLLIGGEKGSSCSGGRIWTQEAGSRKAGQWNDEEMRTSLPSPSVWL